MTRTIDITERFLKSGKNNLNNYWKLENENRIDGYD